MGTYYNINSYTAFIKIKQTYVPLASDWISLYERLLQDLDDKASNDPTCEQLCSGHCYTAMHCKSYITWKDSE